MCIELGECVAAIKFSFPTNDNDIDKQESQENRCSWWWVWVVDSPRVVCECRLCGIVQLFDIH